MKQHITKEQWNELTLKQKIRFTGVDKGEENYEKRWNEETLDKVIKLENFNIGQMIEFLGGDLTIKIGEYGVYIRYNELLVPNSDKDLKDCLWQAVIHKLKGGADI